MLLDEDELLESRDGWYKMSMCQSNVIYVDHDLLSADVQCLQQARHCILYRIARED